MAALAQDSHRSPDAEAVAFARTVVGSADILDWSNPSGQWLDANCSVAADYQITVSGKKVTLGLAVFEQVDPLTGVQRQVYVPTLRTLETIVRGDEVNELYAALTAKGAAKYASLSAKVETFIDGLSDKFIFGHGERLNRLKAGGTIDLPNGTTRELRPEEMDLIFGFRGRVSGMEIQLVRYHSSQPLGGAGGEEIYNVRLSLREGPFVVTASRTGGTVQKLFQQVVSARQSAGLDVDWRVERADSTAKTVRRQDSLPSLKA